MIIDDKTASRIVSKLFFERYHDGRGVEHVQASLVTNSVELERRIREEMSPTKASKLGSMFHFFWRDNDAEQVVNQLGPKALARWEAVWSR